MAKKLKKNNKITTYFLRGALALFIILVIIIASLFLYLNLKKDDISKDLLLKVNNELKGDFHVDKIALGSLFSYPDLEVKLFGLTFTAPIGPNTNGEEILKVKSLKLRTNLSEAISNNFVIQSVFISGAQLYVERDSLGQMVIAEGFRPVEKQDISNDSTNLVISIKNIHIEDLELVIIDRPTDLLLPFAIEKVIGTFSLKNNLITGVADINILPVHFEILDPYVINELPISINCNYSVNVESEMVIINGKELHIGDELYGLNYYYDFTDTSYMDFEMTSLDTGVDLSSLFVTQKDTSEVDEKIDLQGRGLFSANFHWKPTTKKPFIEAIEAGFVLEGKNLKVYGMDLDDVIDKFKRSQEFNFADVGAVMFAGPAGLAITKGSDFARLAFTKAGDSTDVKHFFADWRIVNGKLKTHDVALSTNNNLITTFGWYDIQNDSLDFNLVILDKRGCELAGQQIFGDAKDPEYGKVKLLKTFFGPVTNFFRNIGITKCDTLYFGKVIHPNNKQLE